MKSLLLVTLYASLTVLSMLYWSARSMLMPLPPPPPLLLLLLPLPPPLLLPLPPPLLLLLLLPLPPPLLLSLPPPLLLLLSLLLPLLLPKREADGVNDTEMRLACGGVQYGVAWRGVA